MISLSDGKLLVHLARDSIKSEFSGKPIRWKGDFSERMGVFVTLSKDGELRGCIGFPYPVQPLGKGVVEAAKSAAFKDPRFNPLEEEELNQLTIEVSVLTVPKLVEVEKPEDYFKKIEIGKHGLIVKYMYSSGLLLPQVFLENNCTPEQALEMTCRKAGLYPDAWQEQGFQLFTFEAQIFSEKEPEGEVVQE